MVFEAVKSDASARQSAQYLSIARQRLSFLAVCSQPPIARRLTEIQEAREQSQPIRSKTGGSTFANPDGGKAWQLIDEAGCRGLTHGAAQVSEKHCNFLINTGDACAADIEALGEEVRARVKAKSGVTLEWEIKRLGRPQ